MSYWTSDEGLSIRLDDLAALGCWDVYNRVSYETFKDLGVKELEWITSGDERVCEDCDAHSGRRYRIGQFLPMLPRHVNCRCFWDVA